MPSHEGLGANNCNGLEDCRKPSIKLDEEQTITIREPDTAVHLPPQYDELMSERSVLCLKSALRLERRDEQGHAEAEQRSIIVADVRRFAHVINTDGVLGTHNRRKPARCHRTRVSGRTMVMALRTDGNHRYSWMKTKRSLFVSRTRPRTFRRNMMSCLSERSVFCLKSALRLERQDEQGQEEA